MLLQCSHAGRPECGRGRLFPPHEGELPRTGLFAPHPTLQLLDVVKAGDVSGQRGSAALLPDGQCRSAWHLPPLPFHRRLTKTATRWWLFSRRYRYRRLGHLPPLIAERPILRCVTPSCVRLKGTMLLALFSQSDSRACRPAGLTREKELELQAGPPLSPPGVVRCVPIIAAAVASETIRKRERVEAVTITHPGPFTRWRGVPRTESTSAIGLPAGRPPSPPRLSCSCQLGPRTAKR